MEFYYPKMQVESIDLNFGIDRILSMACSSTKPILSCSSLETTSACSSTKPTLACSSTNIRHTAKEISRECRTRRRTSFTAFQIEKLEEKFAQSRYLVGEERQNFARTLNLDEKQVKIWFQNRRIKYRKKMNSSVNSSDSD